MSKIVTFSKVFAELDSDDDFLNTFELEHSKALDDTGWPNGSVKIGAFPLHIGTYPLCADTFFCCENS